MKEIFKGGKFFMVDAENYYPEFFRSIEPFWENSEQILTPVSQTAPVVLIESIHLETRILFTSLLKIWNFDAVESNNLENTLTLIENEKPSLILFDCLSSITEDAEQISLIKRNKFAANIPIIAISEYFDSESENLILEAGADEYLIKPINFAQLEKLIHFKIDTYQKFRFNLGGLL